ncbi:hypothetical protein AVEN_119013-1 [Araneus ventricosus]|uniref:Uncharacterized protein n=1 Tax=Araneus ventricosus TaxID=182803 RepID=A0A4Y2KPN5_ARAVE|nr:hypothetical protein AVEN_119013-1 [Araneus ventricosus]
MSCGPGLDYLSFMLALSNHLNPPSFESVTILSKHGAWRNTVGIVADALEEGVLSKCQIGKMLDFKNIEVVQANLLTTIPVKGLEVLQHSNVILMMRNFNLIASGSDEEEIIKTKLVELISSLKPDSTIFFIDTKPSMTLFLEVLSKFHGNFLYKPEHLSFKFPISFSEDYREKHGCFPASCARGAIFVWQKLLFFEPGTYFNTFPLNSLTDVNAISKNSLEKASNENDEVLNITKTLKHLILPNNKNLQPDSVGNVKSNSHKNDNIQELVSFSLVNTPKQLEDSQSASIQTLLTTQSIQELSQVNFDEKSCSSHFLKKSSSIDNSFFLGSSKSILLLGESDLLQNSLHSSTIEETYLTSSSQHNAPENNQAVKPTSESKATQTELHQSITNSSPVTGLTERVKRLVSSLENEVQKNIPDRQVNYHLHESPDSSANYSSCSTNYSNNSDVCGPPCCNVYQTEGQNPISCCNYVQMNHAHCCAFRHMMHRCEMHCCRSCVHRCHINHYRPFCKSNIASTVTSLAQPQIVIPLQNVSNDILLQIISAVKSGSKPQ